MPFPFLDPPVSPIPGYSVSATASFPQESWTSPTSSYRPTSSHASWSSSFSSVTSPTTCSTFPSYLGSLPSPTIEDGNNDFFAFKPSPTSPDLSSSTPCIDPFGLSSLLTFGHVQDDQVAGGFQQRSNHMDGLIEEDRQWWEQKKRMEEEPPASARLPLGQPSPPLIIISNTSSPIPPVFALPTTSDHSNPYHELARYHTRRKSLPASSSSSPANLVVLNPPPSPTTSTKKSRSLPLPKPKPYLSTKARPRSSSWGPTASPLAHVVSSSDRFSLVAVKEEENFETALARLRKEKGDPQILFPKLRWLEEEGGGAKEGTREG